LFRAVADLQNVTKLGLVDFTPDIPTTDHSFPLRILTHLLQSVRLRLEFLRLNNVVLNGTKEDCQDFTRVVQQLVCLRHCHLRETVAIMIDVAPQPFDDVLLAITRLLMIVAASLGTEWFRVAGPCTLDSLRPIQSLCSSSTIASLAFDFIHPKNAAFKSLCGCLCTNTALLFLRIKFADFSAFDFLSGRAQDYQLLAASLHSNRDWTELELKAAHCFQPLASALQSNRGLTDRIGVWQFSPTRFRFCSHCQRYLQESKLDTSFGGYSITP
jgi:hypothetical protein